MKRGPYNRTLLEYRSPSPESGKGVVETILILVGSLVRVPWFLWVNRGCSVGSPNPL